MAAERRRIRPCTLSRGFVRGFTQPTGPRCPDPENPGHSRSRGQWCRPLSRRWLTTLRPRAVPVPAQANAAAPRPADPGAWGSARQRAAAGRRRWSL